MRRERTDRQRDNRNHAIEVKRAARLIDAELLRAQAAAHICIEKKHWWSADVELSTEAWQKHSGTIAPDLSDRAWADVTMALEAVDHVRGARNAAVGAGLGTSAIPEATADQLAPMLRDIKLGRGALAPFVFDALPPAGNSAQLPPG